jgi:hypothetical protein
MRLFTKIFLILFWIFVSSFSKKGSAEILWQRVLEGTVNGQRLAGAYSGGLCHSHPAFVDIDNDGDYDLFLGNDCPGAVFFYRNDGSPDSAAWTLATDHFNTHDASFLTPTFVDIDCDHDFDMFVGEWNGNIHYYCNGGTPDSYSYSLVTDEYASIDVGEHSSPTFVDLDADGDYDLFVGESDGNIYFYRNDGDSVQADWTYITWSYNLIDVGFHSKPTFVDIDSDGDYDMFVGEDAGNINFYRNDGDPDSAIWTFVTSDFGSINVGWRSAPAFVDIDEDNDYDMFVGEGVGNVNYYKNDGTPDTPIWTFVAEHYLSIDVGWNSIPAFVDIDADGDQDVFIGEWDGNINFYKNEGTPSQANWSLSAENFNSIDVGDGSTPTFVDIDSDADYDLFVGNATGTIYFYRNDGSDSLPLWTFVTDVYGFINVGSESNPTFIDIDADGDYDLFIGESDGKINYYRNDGDSLIPDWTFITANFYSIDVGGHSDPAFMDSDHDGDYDLLVGNSDGRIYHYENIGTPDSSAFVYRTDYYDSIDVGVDCTPTFVDIDNDGDLDLFTGEWAGGINFYQDTSSSDVSEMYEEEGIGRHFSLAQNYPNPFNQQTVIEYDLPKATRVKICIYNILGQRVRMLIDLSQNAGHRKISWDGRNDQGEELSSGIYFYRLTTEDFSESKKMLLLR